MANDSEISLEGVNIREEAEQEEDRLRRGAQELLDEEETRGRIPDENPRTAPGLHGGTWQGAGTGRGVHH